jgi:hypothetical protein
MKELYQNKPKGEELKILTTYKEIFDYLEYITPILRKQIAAKPKKVIKRRGKKNEIK